MKGRDFEYLQRAARRIDAHLEIHGDRAILRRVHADDEATRLFAEADLWAAWKWVGSYLGTRAFLQGARHVPAPLGAPDLMMVSEIEFDVLPVDAEPGFVIPAPRRIISPDPSGFRYASAGSARRAARLLEEAMTAAPGP